MRRVMLTRGRYRAARAATNFSTNGSLPPDVRQAGGGGDLKKY